MTLAIIHATTTGSLGAILREVADHLVARGWHLAGVIQDAPAGPQDHPCDMDLRVLPSGRRVCINQNLGKGSRGCRLDGGGIEAAAASVATDVASNAPDLLIVNKFGKIEAAGRGFRPLIGDALDWGIPVIVGVNDLDRADLEAFTCGMGAIVATETARIVSWAETARRRSAA